MFQNVNNHWRAQLERPSEETIQSNWGPSRIHRGSIVGLSRVLWRSNMSLLGDPNVYALQMTSPNDLSKPSNKLEKLDKIFHTRTRQELAPFFHCVIESSKNQQQQPPVARTAFQLCP